MFRIVDDLSVKDKKVILRVDFNVPINPDGQIIDDTRIKACLPTINYLLSKNCTIVLLTHLGRPEGIDPSLSLKKIIPFLEKLIHQPIHFFECIEKAQKEIPLLTKPSIALLENLRFFQAEEDPSINPDFAKQLATLGDVYINDAFACCHRSHTSITEVPKFFSDQKGAGFLLAKEIKELKKVLNPVHPFYLVLGGSKVSTKIGIIQSLLPKAEAIFIGGAMAFPFLVASGKSCGDTQIDPKQVDMAKNILNLSRSLNKTVYLPLDWKCKDMHSNGAIVSIVDQNQGIDPRYQAFDIDTQTTDFWSKRLKDGKTIFWNGPLGMYESPPFDEGTAKTAEIIAKIPCESIIGGGDSIAAIEKLGLSSSFSHLSTGGGASLEFLEKGTLPGIEALN